MCPVGCGAQMTRLDFPIVVRRSHFALRAGAGSSGIGPVLTGVWGQTLGHD